MKCSREEAINKAVDAIYVMCAGDRMRERARMREKALHDKASAMSGEREEGEAIGMVKGRLETMISLVM